MVEEDSQQMMNSLKYITKLRYMQMKSVSTPYSRFSTLNITTSANANNSL